MLRARLDAKRNVLLGNENRKEDEDEIDDKFCVAERKGTKKEKTL